MPMQRVGNTNYYVIEANVPQPTDSRGRGYGYLVSDQRWKVWDEISKMVAADMKAAGATDEALLKAQAQQQRLLQSEISQLRRDANDMVSGAASKDAAATAKIAASRRSGGETIVYEPYVKKVMDPFGDIKDVPVEKRVVRKFKGGGPVEPAKPTPSAKPTEGAPAGGEGAPADDSIIKAVQPQLDIINELIKKKEAELEGLKNQPIESSAGPQKDLMTQVQERYAAQMGYGGFGLPKSARPAIDYNVGVGQLESLLKKAEDDAVNVYAASVPVGPLDPREVEAIKREARAKEFDNIANFFGPKEVPTEGPKYLEGPISRGTVTTLPEEKSRFGLRDLFSFDRGSAPGNAPVTTSTFLPPASTTPATTVPTTPMTTVAAPAGVRDVSMSQPEIAARLAANELERQSIRPPPPQVSLPGFNERQAAFDILGAPMPDVTSPTSQQAPKVAPSLEDVQMQRQKEGFKALQQKVKEGTAPLTPGLPGAPETGAKMSVPARRDAYALAVVEGGAKLAAQPKKFERLAKTDLPQNERSKVVAPFVQIVDKLYSTNAGKSDAFNATYDEISRFYANAPDIRKQAHEYLIAKSMLENNVTKPTLQDKIPA